MKKKCTECGHRVDFFVCPEGPTTSIIEKEKKDLIVKEAMYKQCQHHNCPQPWTIAPESFGPHARGWCRWHYPDFKEGRSEMEYVVMQRRKADPATRLEDILRAEKNGPITGPEDIYPIGFLADWEKQGIVRQR